MSIRWFAALVAIAASTGVQAGRQSPPTVTEESQVPAYRLPDPLIAQDGTPVRTPAQWRDVRRPELLHLFAERVYGRTPRLEQPMASTITEARASALGGRATRRQVTLAFGDRPNGPKMHLLMYLPAEPRGRVPVFVGLNFQGNHAVAPDPGIHLSTAWVANSSPGVVNHRATEKSRGAAASRWPIEAILTRGFGLVTAYYGDLDPDFDDGFSNGVHPLFYRPGQTRPAPDEWGAIGAWAWGLSRALDYLETDSDVDARHAAVIGHSRLGKAALWAAAQDERFALVVSNDSGCGGAALSKRIFGETVGAINRQFPHWFAANFREYNENESALPVDQHELLALIAPRPLYVASAAEDLWADPRGEFLAAVHADPVYRLLRTQGLGVAEMPAVDRSVGHRVRYHVRTGKHDLTAWDWEQYLAFAESQFRPVKK
jgi:hypothetical protein